MRPFRLYLATVAALLTIAFQSPAYAETFEEYVQKLIEYNDRHKEYLIKDYETFKPG